jgi:hypothetical protein
MNLHIHRHLQFIPVHTAVVITCTPEIIACVKLIVDSLAQDLFIIFDSCPRGKHPDGLGLTVNSSLAMAASHFNGLFGIEITSLGGISIKDT